MSINKIYSVGGYSCDLEERYEGFGQAKLVEMLKLPEEIREEITPETKRDEIREMGKEHKAAEEVRDQEDFTRAFALEQSDEGLLSMVVRIMLNMEMYALRLRDIWTYMIKREAGEPINEQDVLLAIQPSGGGHVRAGSCFCFFRDKEFAITRGREKETHTYTDIVDSMLHLSDTVELSSPEDWYLNIFGRQLPEEKGVVQNVNKAHNSIGGQAFKKEKKTEKREPKKASKSEADTNSVVPDFVDGVCQVCAGAKDIESNDGRFRIHLTEQGIGRVEKDQGLTGYGIIELDYCPKCGKELG